MSGSNSQSVDHHRFRRAIYDNIGSPDCFANGPESNCPCRKSSDASSDCKGKACCRICSIRWSMPSGCRRRLSPMSRAMLNASPLRPSRIFDTHSDMSISASDTSAIVGITGSVKARSPMEPSSSSTWLGWLGSEPASPSLSSATAVPGMVLLRLALDGLAGVPLDASSVGRSTPPAGRSCDSATLARALDAHFLGLALCARAFDCAAMRSSFKSSLFCFSLCCNTRIRVRNSQSWYADALPLYI